MRICIAVALAACLVPALANPAHAGRGPTPEERFEIESVLREFGVSSWEDIELEEHGTVWEVDDATAPDGHKYDLKLRTSTYEPIGAERD